MFSDPTECPFDLYSSSRVEVLITRKRPFAGADKPKTASQDDRKITVNLAAHAAPIPPSRQAALANLAVVSVNLGSSSAVPEVFTRQSLNKILGGAIQGLAVRRVAYIQLWRVNPSDHCHRCTDSATALARKRAISSYLCPNMDHNPWSPSGPGQHGYMQVGLGRDSKLFNGEGEEQHVFVGAGKFLLYCGLYHVQRVDPLTKEEWHALPLKVRKLSGAYVSFYQLIG